MQLLAYTREIRISGGVARESGLWPALQEGLMPAQVQEAVLPTLFQALLVWRLSPWSIIPGSSTGIWVCHPKRRELIHISQPQIVTPQKRHRSNRKVASSMTLARSTPSKAQLLVLFIQNSQFLPIKALVTVPLDTFTSLHH